MKIELHEIHVRELCAGYNDLSIQEEGIVGYNGRLNIRPKTTKKLSKITNTKKATGFS